MATRKKSDSPDPAQAKIPSTPTLPGLAKIAKNCQACDLWERSTQTVFGEGEPNSKVMFIGEVPGDQEDRAGRPFVGPARQLLNKALAEAGIDRRKVYVTNVVAQALLGSDFRGTQHRGEFLDSPLARWVLATVHPSSILRAPDEETRHEETRRFIADLKNIAAVIS